MTETSRGPDEIRLPDDFDDDQPLETSKHRASNTLILVLIVLIVACFATIGLLFYNSVSGNTSIEEDTRYVPDTFITETGGLE